MTVTLVQGQDDSSQDWFEKIFPTLAPRPLEQSPRPLEQVHTRDAEGPPGLHMPQIYADYIIKLSAAVGPAIGTALGAWLHARYGRKVRIKVGDIEAEAQTPEELEKLLDKVQEIRERNEPKRILP